MGSGSWAKSGTRQSRHAQDWTDDEHDSDCSVFAAIVALGALLSSRDDLHTGDDELLDTLTSIRAGLEEVLSDGEPLMQDYREAIEAALAELTKADELRVAELKPMVNEDHMSALQRLIAEMRQFLAGKDHAVWTNRKIQEWADQLDALLVRREEEEKDQTLARMNDQDEDSEYADDGNHRSHIWGVLSCRACDCGWKHLDAKKPCTRSLWKTLEPKPTTRPSAEEG